MPALDPVTEVITADTIPFIRQIDAAIQAVEALDHSIQAAVAEVGELAAALAALPGEKTVRIVVDQVGNAAGAGAGAGDAAAQAEAAAKATEDLARAQAEGAGAAREDAGAQAGLAAELAAAAAQIERTGRYYDQVVQGARATAHAIEMTNDPLEVFRARLQAIQDQISPADAAMNDLRTTMQAAGDAVEFSDTQIKSLGPGFVVAASRIREVAGAADGAGDAARRAGFGFRFWGIGMGLTRNALHWIVAGSAELLAIGVPALVALGAGLVVAAQGAQNVQRHFAALYATTESTHAAFGQTVGTVLGLGHALQTAQDAANPGVYTILGSVVNDAKSHFTDLAGAGLQVVHMLDEFSARVTVDLKGSLGRELGGLLSGMVKDLQQLGQMFGNLGHALLNFAAAMPGLVHILADIGVALSTVIEWASRSGVLLTFAFAMEEVFRWGGLALGVLARLAGAGRLFSSFAAGGGFITRFGAAIKALVSQGGIAIMWVGRMLGSLGNLIPAFGRAGAAAEAAGSEIAIAGATMSTAWIAGITLGAAALGFLIYKIATAKSATDQWIAASDQMVAKASDLNVLPTIYRQLADTTTKLAGQQGQLRTEFVASGRMALSVGKTQLQSSDALAQHLTSLVNTANTVRGNINLLAGTFHTSAIGALALANAAGVNLQVGLTKGSEAAKIAVQQINNLKAGLGAMSAPASVIGADMEAVGVQSQLAASKVQTVNQALDQFIGTTTGGMSTLAQFEGSLRGMGHDALSSSVGINGAVRSISRDAASMGFTLQGMGTRAQQSWQQFAQAVQGANSVLDTMRTGMAEGVVSSGQYQTAIKAAAGQLLPFAAHSRTARAMVSQLAQEAGFPATTSLRTLAAQLGVTGQKAKGELVTGVEQAITKMANLSQVARNLSAVVSGQLDTAMAGAIVKASGLDAAYTKWASDVKANKAPQALASDLKTIQADQNFVNSAMAKGTTVLNNTSKAAAGLGAAYKGAAGDTSGLTGKTTEAHAALGQMTNHLITAADSSQGFGQQARTAGTSASGLSTQASQATTQVRSLGSAASTTRGSLGTVNNEIRATAQAASGAQGPVGSMIGQINSLGNAASGAAGQVHGLEGAIASLQSKTITVTTNFVSTGTHRQHGGPVLPGVPYVVGEAGREIFVPTVPGNVLPHPETEQILAPAAPHTSPAASAAPAAAGPAVLVIQMNGREVARALMPEMWRWQQRNSGSVNGILRPS